MCGRARCTMSREQIAQLAGVAPDAFRDGDQYRPCENMGPGRFGPVVYRARDDSATGNNAQSWQKHPRLQAMQWGLVPSFTKPTAKPDHFIMFNARSESLHERPAFKRLLETKRCVILSEGYYEWQALDKRNKQPYYIQRTSGPLKFAGLYDSWTSDEGKLMHTYTILTTEISPELSWMHTRIPVILTEEGATRWLSDAKFETLRDLLVAYRGDDLKWHAVDKRVGSTKFQSGDCSKEVDINHTANIASFFGSPMKKDTTTSSPADGQELKPTSTTPTDPVPVPASHPDLAAELQLLTSDTTTPSTTASPSRPPRKVRNDAAKSPIKFLFQQQQLVQQSVAVAEGLLSASPPTPAFAPASTLPTGSKRSSEAKLPLQSPKKRRRDSVSPNRIKAAAKTPVRGTLLAYFQPKS